jgi:hypothetical protein
MSGSATTHSDTGTLELLADRPPMNTQLGTDLAQAPTLLVQVGCTLNVHRDTVTSLNRTGLSPNRHALGWAGTTPHPGASRKSSRTPTALKLWFSARWPTIAACHTAFKVHDTFAEIAMWAFPLLLTSWAHVSDQR